MESDVGGLMPMGGTRETGTHKGYGLAVMAQLLGSTLAGGSFSPFRNRDAKPGASDNIGHSSLRSIRNSSGPEAPLRTR